MNKVDSMPQTIEVPLGATAQFGSLSISLRSCLTRPSDQLPDSVAWLDIVDSHQDEPGFHGWSFANEPWIGLFQHPVYDVRLMNCR